MTGDQYNWCLTVFFFTYAAFEVPSNLVLKKLRPSRWLPTIMVAWGVVMTLMGIVKNYHGLLIARIFLGVAEAGLFPGVAVSPVSSTYTFWGGIYQPWWSVADILQYYLTMWYCRHEMQIRQALFFSAASIAGAFSGLLAFGIAKMDGVGGLEGWRWIFILEGIATVLVAIFAYWALYDFPETAGFLTQEEKDFVLYRLKYQGGMQNASSEDVEGRVMEAEEFDWAYVWQAFKDWQVWTMIVVYWGVGLPPLPRSAILHAAVLIPAERAWLTSPEDCVPYLWDQLVVALHHHGHGSWAGEVAAYDDPHLHCCVYHRSCRRLGV
jgi:sugar phosphate permease